MRSTVVQGIFIDEYAIFLRNLRKPERPWARRYTFIDILHDKKIRRKSRYFDGASVRLQSFGIFANFSKMGGISSLKHPYSCMN